MKKELIQYTALIAVFVVLFLAGYKKGAEDCEQEQIHIERQPDVSGNIQGDTICKPERKSFGYPNNPFR